MATQPPKNLRRVRVTACRKGRLDLLGLGQMISPPVPANAVRSGVDGPAWRVQICDAGADPKDVSRPAPSVSGRVTRCGRLEHVLDGTNRRVLDIADRRIVRGVRRPAPPDHDLNVSLRHRARDQDLSVNSTSIDAERGI